MITKIELIEYIKELSKKYLLLFKKTDKQEYKKLAEEYKKKAKDFKKNL